MNDTHPVDSQGSREGNHHWDGHYWHGYHQLCEGILSQWWQHLVLFSSFLNLVIVAGTSSVYRQIWTSCAPLCVGKVRRGASQNWICQHEAFNICWHESMKSRAQKSITQLSSAFLCLSVVLLHPRSIKYGKNFIIDIMSNSLVQHFCINFLLIL